MSQATVFEALCGGRRESRVVLEEGNLKPVLSTVEWLETRCVYNPQLHYLTFDLGEYLGGGIAPSDLISAWCWDMQDFLKQSTDHWAGKLLGSWPLRGIGRNGDVVPVDTSTMIDSVLDAPLAIDLFRVEDDWHALLTDSAESSHPVVVDVEDPSRLQELNSVKLSGPKSLWYWDAGKWVGSTELVVSVHPKDRGRGVVYYDGMHAHCPVTGKRLRVSPT